MISDLYAQQQQLMQEAITKLDCIILREKGPAVIKFYARYDCCTILAPIVTA